MRERETSRSIDQRAADWVSRLDRGPLSEEEARALDAWTNGDPRRRGALMRANAMAMLSESAQALGPDFHPADFADRRPQAPADGVSRRKLIAWAGMGSVLAATAAAIGLSAPAAGAITTDLGEVRLVTLDDGSAVMLNTQTSVRVRYTDQLRRVELLYGEAYFMVVRDGRRPFVVDMAGAPLRTEGAAFRVRKLPDRPLDILVDRGGVSVAPEDAAAPLRLQGDMRLSLAPGASPLAERVAPEVITRELAWREGKLAFEGERLDQAAAEFARYSKVRIQVRDPALAAEPVAGLFSASDPVGFSRAIAELFSARMEQRADAVILTR